jgi:hypothetical protein
VVLARTDQRDRLTRVIVEYVISNILFKTRFVRLPSNALESLQAYLLSQ